MEMILKYFNELSNNELYDILKLRSEVFVVEQNCPYLDIDNLDKDAYHMYFKDENGICAYLRIIKPGQAFADAAAIGRVISKKRRCGLGTKLVSVGIEKAKVLYSPERIRITAQVYAQPFYEQCGFRQCSEVFLEDDIPHMEMLLEF